MEASLDEIGQKYGTDKVDHGYLPHYERLFAPLRCEPFNMLEIGVYEGASIRMWHEYFSAARIVDLDVNVRALEDDLRRYKFVHGDQTDLLLLELLAQEYRFRLVIDDGSHLWAHPVFTFETLFPWTQPGGFYVCEDILTSYGEFAHQYHGGAKESAAAYFFRLADTVVAGEIDHLQAQVPRMYLLVKKIRAMTFVRHGVIIAT
jgi:hypothetical protein